MTERVFDGKTYRKEGPLYCPNGTRWEWQKDMVKSMRESGKLVRVQKTPLKDDLFENTHMVWFWVHGVIP